MELGVRDASAHAPLALIDATAMPLARGGVARYVDELVRELGAEVAIVCQPRDAAHYRGLAPTARVVIGPAALRWRAFRLSWEQLGLPLLARRLKVGVVHSPHYTMPLMTRRARVVTIHDATFFTDPRLHRPIKRVFFRAWIRTSLRIADRIVSPSQATARELERLTGHPASRIDVIPHGVDLLRFRPRPAGERTAVAGVVTAPEGYLLFLGTIEPRKNVPSLVRAHAQLCRTDDSTPALVIAGGHGWETQLRAALDEHPLPHLVHRLGFVEDADVPTLLAHATIVAYPSEGEGFGLPVLEAMAAGAVVVTTDRLAIPEVGGDAVVYSATDPNALAATLRDLLADESTRANLRVRARERAEQFPWALSGRRHLRVYLAAAAASIPNDLSARAPQ